MRGSAPPSDQSGFPLEWADPAHGPFVWIIFAIFACVLLLQWWYIRKLTAPRDDEPVPVKRRW